MAAYFKLTLIAVAITSLPMSVTAQDVDNGTVVSAEKRNLRTIHVKYGDLNLSSAAGVQRLQNRVRSAARTICISYGVRPLKVMMSERKCYDYAMDGAEPQIADAVRRNGTEMAARTMDIAVTRSGS